MVWDVPCALSQRISGPQSTNCPLGSRTVPVFVFIFHFPRWSGVPWLLLLSWVPQVSLQQVPESSPPGMNPLAHKSHRCSHFWTWIICGPWNQRSCWIHPFQPLHFTPFAGARWFKVYFRCFVQPNGKLHKKWSFSHILGTNFPQPNKIWALGSLSLNVMLWVLTPFSPSQTIPPLLRVYNPQDFPLPSKEKFPIRIHEMEK